MDTEFHKTFVIVVEGGSIAEAARCLNLTPASVALRMRMLEKEFGARLLVRSGWTVTPTEAGRALTELGRNLRWLGIGFAHAHETAEGNR